MAAAREPQRRTARQRRAYILQSVSRMLEDSVGYRDGDEIATQNKAAFDYYFMRPRGDEIPGRSSVVSGDLSAMVEAVTAQVMDAFTSDTLVEFASDGAEDEEQARLETAVVTGAIMQGDPDVGGYVRLQEAIKGALLQSNTYMKCWTEPNPVKTRIFRNVEPEAFAELTAEKPGIRLEKIDYQRGTLRYSERRTNKILRVGTVSQENFFVARDWHSQGLALCPFVCERHTEMRSDLIAKRGFKAELVAKLTPATQTPATTAARRVKGTQRARSTFSDPALDQVEWFEAYALLDPDGDGIAELMRVSFVPNVALFAAEPAGFSCYASGCVLVNPHEHRGVNLYQKLKQQQDIGTALWRSTLDNFNAGNKSRTVYLEGEVDVDTLEDGRVNGNIAVTGKRVARAGDAVSALVVPDMTAGALALIQEQKRTRSELGGAALELQNGQAQLTERMGSQGIDRMYSVMEQLAALMTRTFAETLVRGVYLLVHRTMREEFDEPITMRRRGKPVTTTPSEWPERTRVEVKLGLSPGERRRKADALCALLQAQLALAKERGMAGVLVTKKTFYQNVMDWAHVAEIANGEQYMVDPASPESQQAQAALDASAQAERDAQKRLMNMALGLEQLRVSIDKRNADADRVLEFFKAILDAEKTEAGIVGKAVGDMELEAQRAANAAQEAERERETLGAVDKALGAVKELRGKKTGGGDGAAAK